MDDIKDETPASESAGTPADESAGKPAETSRRSVGPESEARGGGEAPEESLDDDRPVGRTKTPGP